MNTRRNASDFCELWQWLDSKGVCVFFPLRLLVFFESSNNGGFEACEKKN